MHFKRISQKQYFAILNKIRPLQELTSSYLLLKFSELRWYHIKLYATKQLDYIIQNIDFKTGKGKSFSGVTRLLENNIVITVNSNENQNKGRQNFTLMHEISHGFCHIENPNPIHGIIREKLEENLDEKVHIEDEADIMASILMISDEAILEISRKKMNFKDVCNEFECSYACLFIRLFNYLFYNCQLQFELAHRLIRSYEIDNNVLLFNYISQ